MRLLLDTHAMYWYIEGDPQLSATARTLIQDASNDILISPASYWEIAIKVSLGKWKLNRSYEEFLDLALNQYGDRKKGSGLFLFLKKRVLTPLICPKRSES